MWNKIKYFPISAFTVIMGLSGATLILSKFGSNGWLPSWCYSRALWTLSGLAIFIASLYLLKTLRFMDEVRREFLHPIKINFFPSISISLLLLSIAWEPVSTSVSQYLWWPGVVLHTLFMLKAIGYWITHSYEIKHFNPAWFIPAVGNVLVPISGVEHAPELLSYFYFSSGMFFWIILFGLFMNRVIFHGQLPEKFIPTFFIIIAPPAVGFLAYMRLFGSWDGGAMFLLMMALFFFVLLVSMYRSFTRLKFFMSWWAFTFPLTALTVATTLAFEVSGETAFKYMAWFFAGVSAVVIAVVAWHTLRHLFRGEICVMEE